jgi:serine/threonine protein kinase
MPPSRLDDLHRVNSPGHTLSDPQPVPHDYSAGDFIAGKYVLSYPIGEGAMGSVWLARDIVLGAPVALKLLRREDRPVGPQRDYLSERLTREATALASIRHPAIVRVFDFGASSWNDPYLAMELLEGDSLGALLARTGQLVPEYAAQIMLCIAISSRTISSSPSTAESSPR